MYNPTTALNQILLLIPRFKFKAFVSAHNADKYIKSFSTWNQLTVMLTAQMKGWNSLREVQTGFMANQSKSYHLGLNSIPKRSNLSYANSKRPSAIFEAIFYEVLKQSQVKLLGRKLKFKAPLYILDSTFIELCINIFNWAKFRYNKGALKIHTTFEVQNQIPTFIRVTTGEIHDLEGMNHEFSVYSDSIVVFDRIYTDFSMFKRLNDVNASFVTRLKTNIKYEVIGQQKVSAGTGVLSDEIIVFSNKNSKDKYPGNLRVVTYYDKVAKKTFKFITNNFRYAANTIAYIYKKRWQIEIFFKWLKQNLKIKTFMGTNENAVKIQIWVAMIAYLLLSYMKSQSNYCYSLLEFTRVIREVLFYELNLVDVYSANFRSLNKIIDVDVGQLNMI